jgi:hypothetical protein
LSAGFLYIIKNMAEITQGQILQVIEELREKYKVGLITRKEFLMRVAQLEAAYQSTSAGKVMSRLPREVIPEINEALRGPWWKGGRDPRRTELWETKKGGLRARKVGTVDPEKSARAAERFRNMWMRRQDLNPIIRKARIAGGIPGLLIGSVGTLLSERYPEEQEISEELEKIKGQEDESKRRATERAWIMNLFGLLQEDLSPEEKEEVLKEIDSLLVKADGID